MYSTASYRVKQQAVMVGKLMGNFDLISSPGTPPEDKGEWINFVGQTQENFAAMFVNEKGVIEESLDKVFGEKRA